jgi:preprotein translocase subunit SecA
MPVLREWLNKFRTGVAHEPDWKRYKPVVEAIRRRRSEFTGEPDSLIRERAQRLRGAGAPVIESFGLAVEAIARGLRLEPFDVQILGALAMHDGKIAEMQTGEGKTLTAVMTVFANALSGAGAHVWTANDYLARRDAEWMRPAYELLGVSVGFVTAASTRKERRRAYAQDVTYATANEIGFDYLRDGLALEPEDQVQRPFAFVLVDEVDSILIDEARIPLVIAGESAPPEDLAYGMAKLVAGFRRNYDYTLDEFGRNVQLTDRAVAKIEAAFGCGNLFEPRNYRLFTAAQDAAHAHALLRRNVDYIVRRAEIELVDEFKGRVAQSRRWPAGLQTALEAKEGLPLRKQGRILGSITLQNLIALYPRVCGMTGTAATQAEEFYAVYGLDVVVIPTNRPVIREDLPDVIFADRLSKERAVASEIHAAHAAGRPVLVGTASVEESERMSKRLRRSGIPHTVLNARNDEQEASIISRAGERGAVTISTNIAGRGADIPLGGDDVRALGGLYVIGTNKFESRRIDHQLRGRSGRQGDPGSSRFFVSLDDDLMERYGIREALGVDAYAWPPGEPIEDPRVRRAVENVQRIVEGQNLEARRTLWKYEGLIEQHRREMQARRTEVLLRRAPSRDGAGKMSERERRITLIKMDDLWSDYLAAISELRGGIHWVSWTGKDPLHTFLTEATRIFEEMQQRLSEEIAEALDAGEDAQLEDAFDRSATWTYLVTDQPFGTMGERWAKAVANRVRALIGEVAKSS